MYSEMDWELNSQSDRHKTARFAVHWSIVALPDFRKHDRVATPEEYRPGVCRSESVLTWELARRDAVSPTSLALA